MRWIRELSERYQRSQVKAAVSVNSEMLAFYRSLGRDIVEMHAESTSGSGFFRHLSEDPRRLIPNAKGFSQRNLLHMKQFYELFPDVPFSTPQLDAEISQGSATSITHQLDAQLQCVPWGHVKLLCDKCKGDRPKAELCPSGPPNTSFPSLSSEDLKGSLPTVEEIEAELGNAGDHVRERANSQ